jgi:deazaflavin-dependent oxidoreductase (nitroreductase family)
MDRYVLIASNWGQDHHPAWLLNLQDNPEAVIQVRDRIINVRAVEATGDERERLWNGAVQAYGGYQRYQQRTDRQIPVVLLLPD